MNKRKSITDLNILAVIPARGGSKGLPRKNILSLNGKPLIQYTIDAAREVFADADICVSTDDEEIFEVVQNIGLDLPFMRPAHLADDHSTSQDVLIHAVDFYQNKNIYYDVIVLLQPTSPLRSAEHIKDAIKLYSPDIDMVASVKETDSNPYYLLFEEDNRGYLNKSKQGNYTRRQDCPKVWEMNGALYIINVDSLFKKTIAEFDRIVKYEMDVISSIDIDNKLDFDLVELINNANGKNYT